MSDRDVHDVRDDQMSMRIEALRSLLIFLSAFLQPFFDGLFCNDASCMESCIEAHIVVSFYFRSWLLQDALHGHLHPVLDEFDCFCFQIWLLVVWVQLDFVLIPQVSPPGLQVLDKVGLGSWSDVSDHILSAEFTFLGSHFFFKEHYIS